MRITRRKFLKDSAFAGVGSALAAGTVLSAPSILTRSRTSLSVPLAGELHFRPSYVQSGRGPHLLEWAYASDTQWDAFHSNITSGVDGVKISDTEGIKKFGVNVRWNVEGFGYIFITADNGGEFYELPQNGTETLNLNYELAASRVARNRRRLELFSRSGWKPSRETAGLVAISENYLDDARKVLKGNPDRVGEPAQQCLRHAMWASETLELDKARWDIQRRGFRSEYLMGCDSRAIFQMRDPLFQERFYELFNFAAITYFWGAGDFVEDFEPEQGKTQYGMRDLAFQKLTSRGLEVEGRAVAWFHKWVTPEWLREMSYDSLKKYIESHTREMVAHYGEEMYAWEIVNEFHDWANEVQLPPDKVVELTKFACEVARDTSPRVHRVINNCCPYAEYVQLKQWSGQEAKYHQRTPWQFMRDLTDAGVDYTLIGQQMYFPYRDLQDIILYLERFEQFKRPLHLSEVGVTSGPTDLSVKDGKVGLPKEPYVWHRPWDEELQADWLEGVYTLAYSKEFITGCHWFDFVDPYYYIDNGGLLRSPKGETKAAYDRLARLQSSWKRLPRHNG